MAFRKTLWSAVILAALGTAALWFLDHPPEETSEAPVAIEELCARCQSLGRVVNCGHRGSGPSREDSPYAENTLASFRHAVESGASMIELDITLTADEKIVVIHDEQLDRTTSGSGCVNAFSLVQIKSLSAGKGTAAPNIRVEVPTLGEVMAAIDADLNIEIKVYPGVVCPPVDRRDLASRVLAEVRADPKTRRTTISSFDPEVLLIVESLDAGTDTGLISEDPRALEIVRSTPIDALHLDSRRVSRRLVEDARAADVPLRIWTENDQRAMYALARIGVDTIITDHPERLSELLTVACSEPRVADAMCMQR